MKLLFDQNLSFRLVALLEEEYPDSEHVAAAGLAEASDRKVWDYAQQGQFVIVSKDTDFMQMSFVYGAPPKVVCIRRGNCSTREIAAILKQRQHLLEEFEGSPALTYLLLH